MKPARQKELIARKKIVTDPDGYLVDVEKYYVKPDETPWWKIANLARRNKARYHQCVSRWKKEHAREVSDGLSRSYRRLKLGLFSLFGSKCSTCGETDYRVLQLNHLTGNGKEDFEAWGGGYNLYRAILSGEAPIDNYNLLCANCNILYEYVIGRRKRYLSLIRIRIIRTLGGKCRMCGESNPLVLHINHLSGSSKGDLMKYGGIVPSYKAILSGEKSISDIELLCANCNSRYEYEVGRRKNNMLLAS